jgi:hypothetical protein
MKQPSRSLRSLDLRAVACKAAVFAVCCLAAAQANSHDSWLSPARRDAAPGQLMLELATGNRFPVQEFTHKAASVSRSQCAGANGDKLALRAASQQPRWLQMKADVRSGPPLACWLELRPVDIELEPRAVDLYFKEIRASAADRQAWAELRARGLPWRERYRKFARIELPAAGAASPEQLEAARRPAGLGLEIVVVGNQPIATGQPMVFQVLRDGEPLPDFPVELVSERNAVGVWRHTDASGMLRHELPFGGRWLLRGTELRLSPERADTWESRFVTLAVQAR